MNLRHSLTKIILLVCFYTLYFQTIHAFDTSQQLKYEGSYYLSSSKFNHTLTLNIDYFHKISDELFLEGDLVVRANNKEYSKPFIAGPNEIYLSAYNLIENLDLRAGKIIMHWGSSDLLSPLDNFNPSPPSLSLIKNQEKLGVLGFNASYYINDLTYLQTALIPSLKTTPYPDEYLKDSYLANYGSLFQEEGLNINQVDLTYQPAENVIWGLRLIHSFPSFDAGISYYQGYFMDPFPAYLITKPNTSGTVMEITLGYPAKKVVGLEFQGEFPGIEGATLRGDLAYIIPESWSFQEKKILENPYIQGIVSADYTTKSNIYLNGGFIYGLPFERGNDSSSYLYLNANQDIENCDLTPFYISILSLEDMSMVNTVGFDFQIRENVTASLYYLFLLGDSESKLGVMKSSKGLYFSLEWLF